MRPTHSLEQFEAATDPAEAEPLLMMRRSLARLAIAERDADRVAQQALIGPEDARLARCAAHLAREVEAARELAIEAVLAWAGDRAGPLFVHIVEGDPAVVRVQAGDSPTMRILRPGKAGFPAPAEVFDLVEAEKDLCRRGVAAVVDPGPLRDRAIAHIDRMPNQDTLGGYLARGQTAGWYASTLVWIAEMELHHEAERAAQAARTARPINP